MPQPRSHVETAHGVYGVSVNRTISMPSTAAFRLTKKTISYLEHLCTQPPPIHTTAPELTALPIHL